MLYFSEIAGKKVYTEDDIHVGYLEDFIFLAAENPIVTKFIVRNKSNQKLIISTDYLRKINKHMLIEKEFLVSYLEENELYLVKNLLDKQIIDLKGNKIVRVNDVALQQDQERLSIAGVDVGILGIFRRLRLGADNFFKIASFFKIKLSSQFLSWADIQPLELIRGNVKLRKKEEKLEKVRPEDLADYLERTNVINARKFLKILDQILHLFELSKEPIGALITTEYLTVNPEDTVREVIDKIKKETADFSSLYSVYVVNKEKQLIGVASLPEILRQDLDLPLYKFMTQNLIVIHLTTPVEIAMKKFLKYRLSSLPVINQEKRFEGIVNFDDITNYVLERIK